MAHRERGAGAHGGQRGARGHNAAPVDAQSQDPNPCAGCQAHLHLWFAPEAQPLVWNGHVLPSHHLHANFPHANKAEGLRGAAPSHGTAALTCSNCPQAAAVKEREKNA